MSTIVHLSKNLCNQLCLKQLRCIFFSYLLFAISDHADCASHPKVQKYIVYCTVEIKYPKNVSLQKFKDLPIDEWNQPIDGINGVEMIKSRSRNIVIVKTWRDFERYTHDGHEPCDNANLQLSRLLIKERCFVFFSIVQLIQYQAMFGI